MSRALAKQMSRALPAAVLVALLALPAAAQSSPFADALSGEGPSDALGGQLGQADVAWGETSGLGDSSDATPAFRLGDPANPTYGIPTTAPIAGMTLLAQYVGDDVTSGGTGTITGTGSLAVTLTGINDGTPSVDGRRVIPATTYWNPGGNRYQAASAPGIEFGTQDLLVLAYVQTSDGASNSVVVSNHNNARNGFELKTQTNGSLRCEFYTSATGAVSDIRFTGSDSNTWALRACLIDRDGYLEAWGTDRGSGSPTSISAGSAENLHNATNPFTIGASADGTDHQNEGVAWVQIWGCDDCLTVTSGGDDYTDELNAVRIATGGFISETDGPANTANRAGSSWMRVCDRSEDAMRYELMDQHMPRTELSCGRTWDTFTGSELYRSMMWESAATNSFTAPEDPTNAAWTKTNVTAVADSSCGETLFTGDTSCTEIRASSTSSASHSISQGGANNGPEDTSWAAWKEGAAGYVQVHVDATTWATFDLSTCLKGNSGAGATYTIDYGFHNGWCYLGIGGSVAHTTVTFYICDTDAASVGCSFAAADTTSALAEFRYGGSIAAVANETGYHSPTYGATRGEDVVQFDATIAAGPQTFIIDMTNPRNDSAVTSSLADSINNSHELSKTGLNALCRGRNGGATQLFQIDTGISIYNDPGRHFIRSVWAADDVECFVDGVSGGTDSDTSGLAAPAADAIDVGKTGSSGDAPHASVWDIFVYEGKYAPGEAGTGSDTP